jgi:hypothetical protein
MGDDTMRRRNLAATFALCAANAACDDSMNGRELTAPTPASSLLSAMPIDAAATADPFTTPYDWTASAVAGSDRIGPTQAATGGRATGHWRLAAPTLNRAAEQYSFTALSTGPLAAAKGEVQLHTTFVGNVESRVHLDVDCLMTLGDQAWFSGPARRWTLNGVPQPPGLYLVFRVQDNGEGANGSPDTGFPAISGPPMGCALMPPFPLLPTGGNIQVQQQ